MPVFNVSKSIHIKAPREQVFASVRDFKQWREWSPWVIAEPDCPLTYADDGRSYTWNGKIIGSGELAVTNERENEVIDYRLTFTAPFKSENTTTFRFAEKDGGTEVTWEMEGKLPFFIFFLKKMMTAFVGSDYQRGLEMLQAKMETGSVPVKVEFPGIRKVQGVAYVGVRTQCPLTEIESNMERDMGKLGEWAKESGTEAAGPHFSIYHKWDMVKGTTDYTIAVPVAKALGSAPGGLATGEIPTCSAYVVSHTGPYRFLGNAWSSGYMHARAKNPRIFRAAKKLPHFEVYENDPEEVPENELVTLVHFPVK